MQITITKVPTGIHSQLTLDLQDVHRADEYDLETLSKIIKVIKEYNDYQDVHA